MLKLPRLRVLFLTGAGTGWLSPRNDGPPMTGAFSANGGEVREAALCVVALGEATTCGFMPLGSGAVADGAGARRDVGRLAALSAEAAATGTASASSFAPHMPQKRFASEFSLPQRAQRNPSPPSLNL